MSDSIHVEHLGERDADRTVVWIAFHDVGHVSPPLLADVGLAEVLAAAFAFHFLIGVERVGIFVQIDAVVAYARIVQQLSQFGEEVLVTTFVFLLLSWIEEHLECHSFHSLEVIRLCFLGSD